MGSFKQYYESCSACNVAAGELESGDKVENINPQCDHFRSKGVVLLIKKVPQDREKTAGNIVIYKVTNESNEFPSGKINGKFSKGDKLEKTEIQLRKIKKADS